MHTHVRKMGKHLRGAGEGMSEPGGLLTALKHYRHLGEFPGDFEGLWEDSFWDEVYVKCFEVSRGCLTSK